MIQRLLVLLVAGAAALLAPAAAAQSSNIETIEGSRPGEKMTLTITPHVLNEDVSARAVGIESPTGTRWALTLIGISRADSVGLSLGEEALPIADVSRPGKDEVGPTRVYVSQETFLTVAEQSEARLHVGNVALSLPAPMRADMQQIFDTVL
ncbi:hypothetical protein [Salinibacter ruber]|uniref:hypothetical protein n=1 Tax=Salinibacter ruber TaxID=146919 RepID=UPI0021690A48|nr:hypothetical protein [Salinibacter ruber]MCS4134195.1 hypothetical protein [Salinibacter ruber]